VSPDEKTIFDAKKRIEEAIGAFNRTNKTKLCAAWDPGHDMREQFGELFGSATFCLLNWYGRAEEGQFSEDYAFQISTQEPIEDHPVRPALCKIIKRINPPAEIRNREMDVHDFLSSCPDGLKLEISSEPSDKRQVMVVGVSDCIYPSIIDAQTLADTLIRLTQGAGFLRQQLGIE
jgi:hypothetical protein